MLLCYSVKLVLSIKITSGRHFSRDLCSKSTRVCWAS